MKIWEAFSLQAGSHTVNTSCEMAPHCAGSCTNMKQKVGCQEIWSCSEREGLDLSGTQFVHLETWVSFERQIHSFMFVNDHFGYRCMKCLQGKKCLQGWPVRADTGWLILKVPDQGCEVKELTKNERQQCVYNYYLQYVIASNID